MDRGKVEGWKDVRRKEGRFAVYKEGGKEENR